MLYDRGGTSPNDFDLCGVPCKGLEYARRLGLVEHSDWHGKTALWWLTPLGIDWCEGRVAEWYGAYPGDDCARSRKTRFVATWLAALPRDVRINT